MLGDQQSRFPFLLCLIVVEAGDRWLVMHTQEEIAKQLESLSRVMTFFFLDFTCCFVCCCRLLGEKDVMMSHSCCVYVTFPQPPESSSKILRAVGRYSSSKDIPICMRSYHCMCPVSQWLMKIGQDGERIH